MPIASDEENVSTRNMPGLWASIASFTGSDHITPEDATSIRLDRSQWPGRASSALTIGLPNASPTMVSAPIRSRSIVSRTSVQSRLRSTSVTTDPAWVRNMLAVNHPVPCISGQAGSPADPGAAIESMKASTPPTSAGSAASSALPVAQVTPIRSSWRHMTPLGMPVVPPV